MVRGKEKFASACFAGWTGSMLCITLSLSGCDGSDSPAVNPPTAVSPVAAFTVGGTVSGLAAGTQLTLNDNGGSPLTVSANGAFVFGSTVPLDGSFAVTVQTQPAGQACTVSDGAGTRVAANVSSVSVSCANKPEFAFVADVFGNTVSQYTIGAGGVLTPLSPPTVSTGIEPHSVTVDPSNSALYVANQSDNTIFRSTRSARAVRSRPSVRRL